MEDYHVNIKEVDLSLSALIGVYQVPDPSRFAINGSYALAIVFATYQGDAAIYTLRPFAANAHQKYVELCFCSNNGNLSDYTINRVTGGWFEYTGVSAGASIFIIEDKNNN